MSEKRFAEKIERAPDPAPRAAARRRPPGAPAPESEPALDDVRQLGGNFALQRLMRAHGIQASPLVSGPEDADEREAERAADGATRGPAPARPDGAPPPARPAPAFAGLVAGAAGRPLDAATRAEMEGRFGQDFGDVRVHTDDAAARSAEALGASAFTRGRDVVFAPGRYAPGTPEGRRLLAHELAHVVQQGRGGDGLTPVPAPRIQRQVFVPPPQSGGFNRPADKDRNKLLNPPTRPPGTEHSAPLGDVVVKLPDVRLFNRQAMKPKVWSKSTGDVTLAAAVIPIPDLPVAVEVYGSAGISASLNAGVGPAMLSQLRVGASYLDAATLLMNPLAGLALGHFKGRGLLSLPLDVGARLDVSGKLGAAASIVVIKLLKVEGELTAGAGASATATLGGAVELDYRNGVLSFYFGENVTIDVELSFNLDALLRVSVPLYDWARRWNLLNWTKAWRIEAGVDLSYINGIESLGVKSNTEEIDAGRLIGQLFETAKAVENLARVAERVAGEGSEYTQGGPSKPKPSDDSADLAEAAKTKLRDPLDIAHSGYATGWAGKAAVAEQVNPDPPDPHIIYVGRQRSNGSFMGGITRGKGSFQSYNRHWRRAQDIPQLHHIASPYQFALHEAFGANGISIQDSKNKIYLHGHAGSHSPAYHAEVQGALDAAVRPGWRQIDVVRALDSLRARIVSGDLKLYADKEVWPP